MCFINKIISVFIGIILFIPVSFADEIVGDSELIVSLKVNYTETDIFPTIVQDAQGHYLIPLEDIEHFDVQEDYLKQGLVNYHDTAYINLDLLEGTKYNLNYENLDLNITFPAEKMQPQSFDASGGPMQDVDTKLISGAYLNYDVTLSQNDDINYLAGVEELNYFTENGVYSYSFLFQTEAVKSNFSKIQNTTKNQNKFTRLETNWTYENVDKMTNWRVGDSITKASSWSNSTRFAGIQYATNFAVRPNLVTYPLLDFRGKSELPSSIEIFSNSIPIYNAKAHMGDFDITNIPVITGRGDLIVKTQDITGKVQTITIPYYASPSLLRPGLSNFSYEAGFQRQDFTIYSNDYKYLVLNTDYMFGINNYLTSGGHFEFLKNNGAVGVTNNLKIGNFGTVGVSLASNIKNFGKSQRVNCGYSYESEYFDINSNLDWNNSNYKDVYNYLDKTFSSLNYQVSASCGNTDFGNISVNFLSFVINNAIQKGKRTNILSSTYQRNITKKGFLSFTIGTDLNSKRKNNFAYMSFNFNLDSNKSVSFTDSYQNKYHTKQIGISAPITSNMGWGYNANLIKAKATNYNVQVNRNGKTNDIGVYLQKNDAETMKQFNIKGGIVSIDKSYYVTRPITGSLALIKVNSLKNVGVYNNNLLAGYTDDKGKMLVPNVTPYVPSEIRLDDENLPLNTEFEDIALKVAPKTKSAVLLDFNVKVIKSVEMTMFDSNKHFIPFDNTVNIEGLEEEIFVGYEGKVYINDIKNLEVLNGSICDENEENNKCCHFSVPVNRDLNDPVIDLGEAQMKTLLLFLCGLKNAPLSYRGLSTVSRKTVYNSQILLDTVDKPRYDLKQVFRAMQQLLQMLAMTMILIIPGNAVALLATCNISVPTVNFGSFNAGVVRTTSVTATVTCSGLLSLLVSYTVTFSTGSAGIYNPRSMAQGINRLNYNLFKNAAFTQILGNGTSSTVTFTDSYTLGLGPVTKNYTVFARLPSQPLAAAGTFQDTITATVTQP